VQRLVKELTEYVVIIRIFKACEQLPDSVLENFPAV
jgi:hypothetical protein